MDLLGAADQARLLEFVHGSEGVPFLDRTSARDYILRGLSELVASDCVLYRFWDDKLQRLATTATEPQVQAAQDVGADVWRAIVARREHPVVAYWNEAGDDRAIRLSDVMGRPALHRLEIYNHFWRPYAIERIMGARVQISSRYLVDLSCYRIGSEFSERDQAVLEYARFYVGQIVQRAEVAPLVAASVASLRLSPREAEILAWVARGKTNREIGSGLFLAPGTVKKHLDNIYRKLSIRTRTEAAVLALGVGWAAAPDIETPVLRDLARNALGLTGREADVLVLAATGKTNSEIAAILDLAPGTAKRHLENLFRKLEVGTRTEAATLALANLSGLPAN
jgi:DNA-binding CsgD family transcriptional regulator